MLHFYEQKQSDNVPYYDWLRQDVVDIVTKVITADQVESALEIGCASGKTGALLKSKLNVTYYAGLDIVAAATEKAAENIDLALCGNIERMLEDGDFQGLDLKTYDMLLYLDVIEHLQDPWAVLKHTSEWLRPGGYVVLSIPNAGHIYVIKKLLQDRFEYDDRGLLDRTHLRFFTLHTIKDMLNTCGLALVTLGNTNDLDILKVKVFNALTFGIFRKQFVKQYLVVARRN